MFIAFVAFFGFTGVVVGFSVAIWVAQNPSPNMVGAFMGGLYGMLASATVLLGMILAHHRAAGSRRGTIRG